MQASSSAQLYSALSIPFTGVDGKGISLHDLVFSKAKKGITTAQADSIKLWVYQEDLQRYDYLTYFLNNSSKWKCTKAGMGADFDVDFEDGLPAGTAFWYFSAKKADAGTCTVSGAVDSDDFVKFTVVRDQYNFFSYPYPVAFKPWDSKMVNWGEAKSGITSAQADNIKLWVYQEDLKRYDYLTYFYNSAKKWKCTNSKYSTIDVDFPNGLPVGIGFWYLATKKSGSTEFDVTFYSPLAKTEEE